MPASESLRSEDRILKRPDYQRCYRRGRRVHGSLLTLHTEESREGRTRLGMTATRKIGGAVVRQRLRRRTREIYRRWSRRGELGPLDIVVHFKPSAAAAPFDELRRQLQRQLSRLIART